MTLSTTLAIDPKYHYRDALDRPFRVVQGKVIRELDEG
jgi:hypothetical protein